jgi:hypothetical protein
MMSAVVYVGYEVCPRHLGEVQEQPDAQVAKVGNFMNTLRLSKQLAILKIQHFDQFSIGPSCTIL